MNNFVKQFIISIFNTKLTTLLYTCEMFKASNNLRQKEYQLFINFF